MWSLNGSAMLRAFAAHTSDHLAGSNPLLLGKHTHPETPIFLNKTPTAYAEAAHSEPTNRISNGPL